MYWKEAAEWLSVKIKHWRWWRGSCSSQWFAALRLKAEFRAELAGKSLPESNEVLMTALSWLFLHSDCTGQVTPEVKSLAGSHPGSTV